MARYEWVTSVETAERIRKLAPASVSVITIAKSGEPYTSGDYTGRVGEGHVYLALVGRQEGIDQLWRDYYEND